MKLLLDANFLVSSIEYRIDLMNELRKFGKPELFTLRPVVDELKELSGGRGRASKNAKLALMWLKREKIKAKSCGEGHTDKIIIDTAAKAGDGCVVCTVDRKLRDSLIRNGVSVVTIRQKSYLAFIRGSLK